MRSLLISVVMLKLSASLCSAQAAVNSERTLIVRGHGRAQIPPDHATKAKSVEDATAAHRQRASRAVSVLREMAADGVEIAQSTFGSVKSACLRRSAAQENLKPSIRPSRHSS